MIRELSLSVRGSGSVWVGTARPERPRCGDPVPRRPRRGDQQPSAGDRLTCPLQRRWSALGSRGPKGAEVETLDTGEGWRKQESGLPKRGCGAPEGEYSLSPRNGRGGGGAREEEGSANAWRWTHWDLAQSSSGRHSRRASGRENTGGHRSKGREAPCLSWLQ